MRGLTKRQREVLQAIRDSVDGSGFPPTIRELGDALGIRSTNGVNDHLKALERKGFISREQAKSRAVFLTETGLEETGGAPASAEVAAEPLNAGRVGPEVLSIPLLGRIAAGSPIEAIEQADEYVVVEPSFLGRHADSGVFALEIDGDSMIGDGILDGDTVFIRPQQTARRGEIVAAVVDGSATLKRYYPENGGIRLQPSNDQMEPIFVHGDAGHDVRILGLAVSVMRRLN